MRLSPCARALVAYDAVRDPRAAEKFCADHRLHGRALTV
jgi:hypothetical protein